MTGEDVIRRVGARLERVREGIHAAAARRGRDGAGVGLVAVTKYAPAEQVQALRELGHRDLGENRTQQLVERAASLTLPEPPQTPGSPSESPGQSRSGSPAAIRWHMIGHLQRNKAKHLLPWVHLLHSLDSSRLIGELEKLIAREREQSAAAAGPSTLPSGRAAGDPLDVLIEVNIAGEANKHGIDPEGAIALAHQAAESPALRLRGLMTMAPYDPDPETARPVFARLAALFERIGGEVNPGQAFDTLSMGMSGDYEVAVEEGATLLRLGSVLFEADG